MRSATRKTRDVWLARILAVSPDVALAVTFLITWIRPGTFGERMVAHLVFVMLLEFVIVNASAIVGQLYVGSADREEKTNSLLMVGLFYTLLVAGFSGAIEALWPIAVFWGLMLNRLLGVMLGQAPIGDERRFVQRGWTASFAFYLVFAVVTSFVPLPILGITNEVVDAQELSGEGTWIVEPHRAIAFGFLYFATLALSEIFNHAWMNPKFWDMYAYSKMRSVLVDDRPRRAWRSESVLQATYGQRGPDVLEFTQGGGAVAAAGLLVHALGIFVAILPFWVPDLPGSNVPPRLMAWTIFPLGLFLCWLGATVAFGRTGIVLDRGSRTAVVWWGFLVPFSSRELSLEDASGVIIGPEDARGGATVYPVRLGFSGEEITLIESKEHHQARRCAEVVANFLELGIDDSTEGGSGR